MRGSSIGHAGVKWLPNESPTSWDKKTGENPTDWGKHGVKYSLLTDGKGLLLALAVDVPILMISDW
ncbi:hypothetical protein VY86_07625 [Photorhabdus thracensis]|uniref:Uncharacterized protein n=1 Tax=Photorhabdus thracensis TaxID=230089 RepID=A0A0F7LN27_9GAMM|nr:hypothetical protein VY86_07625 [Photorhabdus thracensis]MCC8422962.1 hypothetical protein [Photorhabdus thracensis]